MSGLVGTCQGAQRQAMSQFDEYAVLAGFVIRQEKSFHRRSISGTSERDGINNRGIQRTGRIALELEDSRQDMLGDVARVLASCRPDTVAAPALSRPVVVRDTLAAIDWNGKRAWSLGDSWFGQESQQVGEPLAGNS